jgi:type I restriction enzyme S subunit
MGAELSRGFLFQLLLSDLFKIQAISFQDRTGIPKINRAQLGSVLIPRPEATEQTEISEALFSVDTSRDVGHRRHAALQQLFRTLLHQLMTAQIRLHDLDVPELEAATAE